MREEAIFINVRGHSASGGGQGGDEEHARKIGNVFGRD